MNGTTKIASANRASTMPRLLGNFAARLGTALFLALSVTSMARANLITNPGFELPNIGSGTFSILASIPGWTAFGLSGIEIQDHVAGSPFEGGQHVELDSNANSGMSQIIATTPGTAYDLSVAYSPRPGVAASSNGVQIFWDSVPVATLLASGIGLPDTAWTVHHFLVTATGTSSSLQFLAVGTSDSLGGYLDAVGLVAVSEPVSLSLLGLGLSLVALVGGRRRKRE
jgi:hypothetical protein